MKATPSSLQSSSPLSIIACPLALSEMQDVEGGKYCHLCKHTLRDFTRSTPQEIDEAFANGAYCGIFLSEKVQAWRPAPAFLSALMAKPYAYIAGSFLTASVLLTGNLYAQGVPAHSSHYETVFEKSSVHVLLDGRIPLIHTYIILSREDGTRLAAGSTDDHGVFKFEFEKSGDLRNIKAVVMYKGVECHSGILQGDISNTCVKIHVTKNEFQAAHVKALKLEEERRNNSPKTPGIRISPGK